jgi:acetyl esterase/lipase
VHHRAPEQAFRRSAPASHLDGAVHIKSNHGGDPARVYVMGPLSAGGGLAGLLAADDFALLAPPVRSRKGNPSGAIMDDPAGLDMYTPLRAASMATKTSI